MKKLIPIALIFLISCKKESLFDTKNRSIQSQAQNRESSEDQIVLGNQKSNPYTVSIMREAYMDLGFDNQFGNPEESISTSHYYLKIIPRDSSEYNLLSADSTVELFCYPLDYEIITGGTYYHDSEYDITPQYLVIPENQLDDFNDYEFIILSHLFLEENDKDWNNDSLYDLLESRTYFLCGEEQLNNESTRGAKWYPWGKIRAYDNAIGQLIPLEGVKVRARNWFTIKSDYTDILGNYTIGSFDLNTGVDLSIVWETNSYDIRDGAFSQATYIGPNEINQEAWNLDITETMYKTVRLSAVHRAAYMYFHKNIHGLKRPTYTRHLVLRYYHSTGDNKMIGWWPGLAEIKLSGIYNYTNGPISTNYIAYREIDHIISTTLHEIAHASHIDLKAGILNYAFVDTVIYESWADAVSWYLTKKLYEGVGFNNIYTPGPVASSGISSAHNQYKKITYFKKGQNYTPLFIDLADDFNQSIEFGTQECSFGGTFDGANCFVMQPPSGETAFIYDNNFYYTPVGINSCPIAGTWYDGANCFVMDIPQNASAFIYDNKMYFTPNLISEHPFDDIYGFTMNNIEQNILPHANNIEDVKTKAKNNKPSYIQNSQIENYINTYYDEY